MGTSRKVILGFVIVLLLMQAIMDGYLLYLVVQETHGNPDYVLSLYAHLMRLVYFTLFISVLFSVSAAVIIAEVWKRVQEEIPKPYPLLGHP